MADLGTCMGCVEDIRPVMVSGRLAHAESIARRFQTPNGGLIDDPTYGYDIAGELNDDVSTLDLARMKARGEAECLKDERTLAATLTLVFANGVLTVTIILTDAQGPFVLVLSVTQLSVQLLTVGR